MGGAILQSSNSASLATAVFIPDTAAKLVPQQSVSWRNIRQLLNNSINSCVHWHGQSMHRSVFGLYWRSWRWPIGDKRQSGVTSERTPTRVVCNNYRPPWRTVWKRRQRERERRRSRHRYVSWSRRVTKWFSINRSQTRRRCCLKATSVSQSSYFVFKAINTCCLSSTTVVCCPFSDINEIDTRHVVSGKHVVRSMMVQLDKKYWLIGIAISW